MFRKVMLAVVVTALAVPVLAAAHDDEFESDWGWIDDGPVIEEYDFEGGDVSVDMDAPGAVSFETFHDGLSPHGQWVTVGAYGRVWHPRGVATGWRPYYHGRWEWTHEGWLWVSSEPWGWATYHYGRWAFDSFYGWVWVPGYQWAPAWVSWRFGTDYIGWAPLGPGLSVYVTNYPVVYDHWCFVPSARFVGVPVHSHAFVGPRARSIYTRTQPAPPRATVHGSVTPAWGGPARPFVEKRAGRAIAPVRVQPVASPRAAAAAPTRQGVVPVYRPEAARPSRGAAANRSGAVTAPSRQGGAGSNAITAPPGRSGATTGPGVSAPSRSRSGQGSQPAPARPGGTVSGGASRDSAPPAASPPPARAPSRGGAAPAPARPRSDRIDSGSAPSRSSGAPSVAPPARSGGSSRGGSIAAPPRGGGGGSSVAPPRGGGSSGRSAASVGGGGGGRGGGGGGGRSSGHAVPNRR